MKKRIKIVRKEKTKLFRYGFKCIYPYQMLFNDMGQLLCVNTFIPKGKSVGRYFSAGSK